jgi:pSer/pThr/pTyr-binding forkhead associated (FHA) protein
MKPNPVLLNERALQGEHELQHGDRITIGETTLQFGRH